LSSNERAKTIEEKADSDRIRLNNKKTERRNRRWKKGEKGK